MINVFQPSLSKEEVLAFSKTIETNWLGRGTIAAEFERAWAKYIGVEPEQCLAITSATEGLFIIMQMILSPGDEVIIPSIHFHGVANAVIAAGGRPVFCDVDNQTLNTTSEKIKARITDKTIAVCVLHYGGYPCEIDRIKELCETRFLFLIEDNANSPTSTYKGVACGTWGDFGVTSFDSMKVISTGDGGMLYAKKEGYISQAKQLLYLGLDETSGLSSARERWWEFAVNVPGRRGLMNDLTAAIGIEQLKKLPEFIEKRTELFVKYHSELSKLHPRVILFRELPFDFDGTSSFYFYPIQLADQATRDGLAHYLRNKDIYVTMRYFPLHRVEYYQHDAYPLPGADYAADHTLLLPLHQGLSFDNIEFICDAVREYFRDS